MKIRIKGNAIRYRLTKSDVQQLSTIGKVIETTSFPNKLFTYALQVKPELENLEASFEQDTITLFVPETFAKEWPENNTVGINATMPLPGTGSLYLLVEKDFVCLDDTTEDQSDHYENPNKTC